MSRVRGLGVYALLDGGRLAVGIVISTPLNTNLQVILGVRFQHLVLPADIHGPESNILIAGVSVKDRLANIPLRRTDQETQVVRLAVVQLPPALPVGRSIPIALRSYGTRGETLSDVGCGTITIPVNSAIESHSCAPLVAIEPALIRPVTDLRSFKLPERVTSPQLFVFGGIRSSTPGEIIVAIIMLKPADGMPVGLDVYCNGVAVIVPCLPLDGRAAPFVQALPHPEVAPHMRLLAIPQAHLLVNHQARLRVRVVLSVNRVHVAAVDCAELQWDGVALSWSRAVTDSQIPALASPSPPASTPPTHTPPGSRPPLANISNNRPFPSESEPLHKRRKLTMGSQITANSTSSPSTVTTTTPPLTSSIPLATLATLIPPANGHIIPCLFAFHPRPRPPRGSLSIPIAYFAPTSTPPVPLIRVFCNEQEAMVQVEPATDELRALASHEAVKDRLHEVVVPFAQFFMDKEHKLRLTIELEGQLSAGGVPTDCGEVTWDPTESTWITNSASAAGPPSSPEVPAVAKAVADAVGSVSVTD